MQGFDSPMSAFPRGAGGRENVSIFGVLVEPASEAWLLYKRETAISTYSQHYATEINSKNRYPYPGPNNKTDLNV